MQHHDPLIFVGTYTQKFPHVNGRADGIYVFRFNSESGKLVPAEVKGKNNCIGKDLTGENPTYLCTDSKKRRLFSVQEIGEGEGSTVNSIAISKNPLGFSFLNTQKTSGMGGCHVSISEASDSSLLFVSHYGSGSFSVFPVQEHGVIGELTQNVKFSHQSPKQDGPHAHATFIDHSSGKFAFVVDLGGDRVYQYEIDHHSKTLKPNAASSFFTIAEGSGPRHMVFHPSHLYAYIMNELNATITACKYDSHNGTLSFLQTVSTRGDFKGEKISSAAIRVSPDGKALYASNRFHDSIAVFLINEESGMLEFIQDQDTHGKVPRDFIIDDTGRWLLVANQESDSIITFSIDQTTRKITKVSEVHAISPVCLCIS